MGTHWNKKEIYGTYLHTMFVSMVVHTPADRVLNTEACNTNLIQHIYLLSTIYSTFLSPSGLLLAKQNAALMKYVDVDVMKEYVVRCCII